MSEEKAICSNPECGNDDVSDNVKNYSLDNYGVILCYPCQELVRSGKLDVEALKKTLKKKGTLEGYASEGDEELAKESDEGLEEYDREVGAELEAEVKGLDAKIIYLVTAMDVPDESKFHAWLKSEYGVGQIADLALEDKRKVLEETKRLADKTGEGKVIDAEVVDDGGASKWRHTVEIDEGEFSFHEEDEKLLCRDGANGNVYGLKIDIPECPCGDFEINKEKREWCKHLKAAKVAGYDVRELPKVPEETKKALAKPEKEKVRRAKAKKEEVVAIEVLGKRVDLVVQTPQEIIQNEEMAAEMIKTILGPNPKREDVIEEYGNIKEIAADVLISLAQYAGIRFQPFNKEIEVTKINLGKVFKAIPMSEDKKAQYGALADFMPDTAVTVRCKITSIAGWLDKKGDLHFGMGTKEEHLTPYKLKDIATRGANFIETMCESKSAKKSILNCLPITHDGLLRKIEGIYGWGKK